MWSDQVLTVGGSGIVNGFEAGDQELDVGSLGASGESAGLG